MKDLNREIIAKTIFEAELYALDTVELRNEETEYTTADWKEESEVFREYRRLQADYLLSKFRMILIDDNETPKP